MSNAHGFKQPTHTLYASVAQVRYRFGNHAGGSHDLPKIWALIMLATASALYKDRESELVVLL